MHSGRRVLKIPFVELNWVSSISEIVIWLGIVFPDLDFEGCNLLFAVFLPPRKDNINV